MVLERATRFPQLVGTLRDDQTLELPNDLRLILPTRFFASIVGVIWDPLARGTFSGFDHEAGRQRLSCSVEFMGTGFLISRTGWFVTAAHSLPDEPDAIAEGQVGLLLTLPQGLFAVPVRQIEVDEDRDVAVGVIGVQSRFDLPFLPLNPSPPENFDARLLVTAGFPGTQNSESELGLWPDAFCGRDARWTEGDHSVTHRGRSVRLIGPFVEAEFGARPGLSGGPLCALSEADGRVSDCRAIGLLSWAREDERVGMFASIQAVLDLPLSFVDGRRTLRKIMFPERASP